MPTRGLRFPDDTKITTSSSRANSSRVAASSDLAVCKRNYEYSAAESLIERRRKRGLKAADIVMRLLSDGAPGPWQEFIDAAVGPFGDLLHDAAYVGEGFDAVQFASFDDGVDCRCSFATRL